MSTPKHTPGPWSVREGGNTFHTFHVNSGSRKICLLNANKDTQANARLIAAAPELLEALKDTTEALRLYLESIEDGKDDDAESAYQRAFALLEKLGGAQ